MSTAHIFIDTNTALHFLRPDQIDWQALTGAREVLLIAAPIFVRELDYQKVHNPSRKLRARAGDYLKWLSRFVDEPDALIRPWVRWHFIPDEPLLNFPAHRLLAGLADDHLIASYLSYKPRSAARVLVATADVSLKVKLVARGIPPLLLPEEARLPSEVDAEEKELRDLRRELARLKSRAPDLSLIFINEQDHLDVALASTGISDVQSVDDMRREYPKLPAPGSRPSTRLDVVDEIRTNMLRLETDDEVIAYNDTLDRFYDDWAQHVEAVRSWESANRRQFAVRLVLVNRGTLPASDIDASIAFPVGVTPRTDDQLPERPAEPERPRRRVNTLARITALMSGHADVFGTRHVAPSALCASDGQLLADPGARRLDVSLRTLKHNHDFLIAPFTLSFDRPEDIKSFEAEYKITLAEVPDVITGTLRFIVTSSR